MGWSLGYDERWKRDIGYGVPAWCDHPDCVEEIDRGLAYVCCDEEPYGGDKGCGLYFCHEHVARPRHICQRCLNKKKPFTPKSDHPDWINHKSTHESWAEWRAQSQPAEGAGP